MILKQKYFQFIKLGFIFLIIFSSPVKSQIFLDIENAPTGTTELQEEGTIFEEDLQVIDDLTQFQKSTRAIFKKPRTSFRYQKRKLEKPEPFKAYIKKNAIIYGIDQENVTYRVKRQLLIMAEERFYGGQFSYIYDSRGKRKFTTLTNNLTDISKDLKLKPDLPSHEEFEAPTQLHTTNKSQRFENSFYYKLDSLSLGYYNDLFDTSGLTGYSERFEYRIFALWDFPVDFGFTFSKEGGISQDDDGNSLAWSSFYFGPAIKYTFSDNSKRKWELYGGYQRSLAYVASHINASFPMSVNVLEFELLWKRKTKWGIFILGGTYRQQYMTLETNLLELERNPSRDSVSSLGFSVGYEFSFEL